MKFWETIGDPLQFLTPFLVFYSIFCYKDILQSPLSLEVIKKRAKVDSLASIFFGREYPKILLQFVSPMYSNHLAKFG